MEDHLPQSVSTARIYPDSIDESDRKSITRGQSVPTWKRLLDITSSVIGLVMFSPLFVIVACWIKATSRGPVFFRQRRIGHLGQPFTMWKFRTMVVGADTADHEQYVSELVQNEGELQKMDRNEQLIALGRWLRKSCIDELPQLINVLCGNMSLVGPRPDVVTLDTYPDWQRQRFDVLPGMTGLWQVNGKNTTTHARMIELDITYAAQCSMLLDTKILLKTIPVVLKQCLNKKSG